MRHRKLRTLALLAMGYSFQIFGCQSEVLGQFLADTIKDTAVGVSGIVINGALDRALGLVE